MFHRMRFGKRLPATSYTVDTLPGFVIKHRSGGRHRAPAEPIGAFPFLTIPFAIALFSAATPASVTPLVQYHRVEVGSAMEGSRGVSQTTVRAFPGSQGATTAALDSGPTGIGISRDRRDGVDHLGGTVKCSLCGATEIVERGVDKQDRPVALCADCSAKADKH